MTRPYGGGPVLQCVQYVDVPGGDFDVELNLTGQRNGDREGEKRAAHGLSGGQVPHPVAEIRVAGQSYPQMLSTDAFAAAHGGGEQRVELGQA
jgi:hypothetical protein